MGAFDDLIPSGAQGGTPDIVVGGDGQPTRMTVRPPGQPQSSEAQPQTTALRAFGRGAANAATFNFLDELNGLIRAGGGNPDDEDTSNAAQGLWSLLKGGYGKLTGDPEAERLYGEEVGKQRGVTKQLEQEHPQASLAGNIVGAVALPIGGLANAATLPARMGRGAALGATVGALSGAGEGEDATDRMSRGLVGGGLGFVAGGALPPVVEGVAKGVGAAVSKPVNMVRAVINPEGTAERAVGRAYNEAVRSDPNAVSRLTPAQLASGEPQAVVDTLGGEGRNLARSAANISGGARDTLNHALDDRFEGQSGRFAAWFNSAFNFPNAHAQQKALDQVEKTVNDAAYKHAYRAGDRPVWSPELERLVGSPAVQDAMRSAATTGKDRAINQGFGGFNSPITIGPGGQITLNRGPNGVPTFPNLQFWDYTRRELSNAADKAARAGANEDASRIGQLARAMNKELDQLVPAYGNARAGAARFFGAENALEAGKKFVTENFSIPRTREALAAMSPLERQLFQDGFVSHYVEMLRQVPDRADVTRRIYNSDAAREKIHLALGKQRADELEAMVRLETIMQMQTRAVQGNSTTAAQIATLGLAGAAGGGYLGFDPSASGVAAALATAGKRGVDARVAQKIAELLTSKDPAVIQRGIQAVARSPHMMKALRSIDLAGTKAGAGQVPTGLIPPMQSAGVSRADQNEPAVPGPPGQ